MQKRNVRTLLRDIKHLVCNVIVIAWDNDLMAPIFLSSEDCIPSLLTLLSVALVFSDIPRTAE